MQRKKTQLKSFNDGENGVKIKNKIASMLPRCCLDVFKVTGIDAAEEICE